MLISENIIICLLFLIPFFVITILRSAIIHIFQLGKSKSRIKKTTKQKQPFEKLLLLGFVESCDSYLTQAMWIRRGYWSFLLLQTLALAFWIVSCFHPNALVVVQYILLFRAFSIDIPSFVLLFVMTKHGKNGGVTWKWDV